MTIKNHITKLIIPIPDQNVEINIPKKLDRTRNILRTDDYEIKFKYVDYTGNHIEFILPIKSKIKLIL